VEQNAVGRDLLFPKLVIAAVILSIGLYPAWLLEPVTGMIGNQFHLNAGPVLQPLIHTMSKISLTGVVLILITVLLLVVRRWALKPGKVTFGPTWGCGYTAGTPRQQYTATSFAANFAELADPVMMKEVRYNEIREEDIFPLKKTFTRRPEDVFRVLLAWLTDFSILTLKRIARLQTGNIQHYILYAFIFMMIIFALLYLNVL
jgi:hydrogenase-4 component B